MLKVEDEKITFSSGRSQYTFGDDFGIDSDLETVTYGSDGSLDWWWKPEDSWLPPDMVEERALLPEDMIELADVMIARWQAFKAKLQRGKPDEAL